MLHTVEVNIIVAGTLHLGKRDEQSFRTHVVDIDKLDVVYRIAALKAACECISGVDGGEAGNVAFYGLRRSLTLSRVGSLPLRM